MLTRTQLLARYEALEECAGHLDLDWTDDPVERAEGKKLAAHLRARAAKVLKQAQQAELNFQKGA